MTCEHNDKIVCSCANSCDRHGKCCECVAFHRDKGNLPVCLRNIE